jgi:hypothetical protein
MKKTISVLVVLFLINQAFAYSHENMTTTTEDVSIFSDVGYNGFNYCQADLNALGHPDPGYEALTYWNDDHAFQFNMTLNYAAPNSCDVSLYVGNSTGDAEDIWPNITYAVFYANGDVNVHNFHGNGGEYTTGEEGYFYDIESTNHFTYADACNATYVCSVDIVNNSDGGKPIYIAMIKDQWSCLNTSAPYVFMSVNYTEEDIGNSRTYNYYNTTAADWHYSGDSIWHLEKIYKPYAKSICRNLENYSCTVAANDAVYPDNVLAIQNIRVMDDNCTGIIMPTNGSITNRNGLPTTILGINMGWFFTVACALIITLTFMSIAKYSLQAALVSAALELDFMTFILLWMTVTPSVLLLLNSLAVISFLIPYLKPSGRN